MDLGQIKYRCHGVNILQEAIHKDHGLVWSDGQGIFLTPVSLLQDQVENQDHSKLGEFDRGVKSIHWSEDVSQGLCYMCVVHDRNISIWKVEGHQPKMSFRQIRKINIQPIPQGCLWNPSRDILCVLCQQQSSLYYSHVHNKGSQVLLQLDRDKIRCGCWSADGVKLIICIGTTLMVYQWSDIDVAVTQYAAVSWTVPGLKGHISSTVAISPDRVLVAAELPLESLCKQRDTFLLPDLLNSNSNGPITDELADVDIIRPKGKQASATDSLLNLQRNTTSVIEDCSRLICIELRDEREPVRVCSVKVKGVLTPDLLLFQANVNQVLVGSNTQTLIQVFSYNKEQLTKTLDFTLYKEERPKGLACLPKSCSLGNEDGVLILVGKSIPKDATFPSSTSSITMKSVLKFFNLKHARYQKNPLSHTQSTPSIPVSVATNGHHDSKDFDSIYDNVINFNTNLKNSSPDITKTDNKENNNTLIRELSAEEKSSEIKVGSILTDVPKTNGCHGDDIHVDSDDKIGEAPVPPKRPVRKKKSMRKIRDDVSRHSSGSSQGNAESATKMPMEYLSDSPEMSPRNNGHQNENSTSAEASPDLNVRNEIQATQVNGINDTTVSPTENSQIVSKNEHRVQSYLVKNISTVSEHSLPLAEDNTKDMTSLQVRVQNKNTASGSVAIIEIGDNENTLDKELEVQRNDFESQKRNFGKADFQNLCTEESDNQKVVDNYLEEKLKSKGGSSDNVSELVAAKKLSISMESLEDIDKLLQEQNEKIAKLQEQMKKLSKRVDESSCVLPTRYQSANKPDTVQICFRCKDGFKIEKKFLLDNGRLQLEQVKQAFSLETVEMYIDNEACVVGCNIDGYIPVRFEPASTVTIGGKPAMT